MPVVINGTTGITNDAAYNGDGVTFADNTPANTLVTTSTGNVGIGTSSPAAKLDIRNGTNIVANFVGQGSVGNEFVGIGVQSNYGSASTYSGVFYDVKNENGIVVANALADVKTDGAGAWGWEITPPGSRTSDRRRRGANLYPGATAGYFEVLGADGSANTGSMIQLVSQVDGSTQESFFSIRHRSSAVNGNWFGGFLYNNTVIGSISQNGTTAVSYNTTSDYRLKENIKPLTGGLARVAALKPCTYTWKAAPEEVGEGFIAHELAEVCPQAVTGEKDAVNEDGSIKPQSIDTSFLVATLTAALQELKAELDSVKTELAALKGATA